MDLAWSIDEVFAAAFDPARWPDTLDALSGAANAVGATLVFGLSSRETVAVATRVAAVVSEYPFDGHISDPREDRVKPSLDSGFQTDFDIFTAAEIDRDPFYQCFLRPHGFGWHGAAALADGARPVVLSLKRSLRQGPYERADVARLDGVLPYLRAIARAASVVHGDLLRSQFSAFDAAGQGALTLDRTGGVLDTNRLLRFGDGLQLREGRPVAAHRGDRAALQAAIDQALHPARPSSLPPPPRVPLRRPSGKRPLLVEVLPLIGQPGMSLLNAVALLLVTDLDAAVGPRAGDLRDVFGLTPREAEFAASLAAGERLDSVAERMQISREHARQRLKTIFRKTDTHRQGELVALLARLARPQPNGDGA